MVIHVNESPSTMDEVEELWVISPAWLDSKMKYQRRMKDYSALPLSGRTNAGKPLYYLRSKQTFQIAQTTFNSIHGLF